MSADDIASEVERALADHEHDWVEVDMGPNVSGAIVVCDREGCRLALSLKDVDEFDALLRAIRFGSVP